MPSKCLLKALLRIRIQIKKSDLDPTLAGSFYRKLSSEIVINIAASEWFIEGFCFFNIFFPPVFYDINPAPPLPAEYLRSSDNSIVM